MPLETSALSFSLFTIQLEASLNNVYRMRFTCQDSNSVVKKLARYSSLCLSCEN